MLIHGISIGFNEPLYISVYLRDENFSGMKKILFVLLLLASAGGVMAQQVYNSSGKTNYKAKKKKGYDPDKLFLGSEVIFGINPGYASLGLTPAVGYRIKKPLIVGVGLGYQYLKEQDKLDPYDNILYLQAHIVKPNVWARCFVYRQYYFTLTYEYDIVSLKEPMIDGAGNVSYTKRNVSNVCLVPGVGARQPISGRAYRYFELVYDVLQGNYSPYPAGSPGLKLGFALGL